LGNTSELTVVFSAIANNVPNAIFSLLMTSINDREQEELTLEIFSQPGKDEERSHCFSKMVLNDNILRILNGMKAKLWIIICQRVHEKLFAKFTQHFLMSNNDIMGGSGMMFQYLSSSNLTMSINFSGQSSALWLACTIDSVNLVRHIMSLEGDVRDDPSPDGTTAFSIALAKENYEIVKLFLDSEIEQKEDMKALHQAANMAQAKSKVNALYQEAAKAKMGDELVALQHAAYKATEEMEALNLASRTTEAIQSEELDEK
jgi:ankyrin repeat protein